MAKSKDLKADEAIAEIQKISAPDELKLFVHEDEERSTVLKAAESRMGELMKAKQGEEKGPLTKKTDDFKGPGVEGTKAVEKEKPVTGEDVLKILRAKGTKI